jgi:hypothetical protein
VFLGELWRGRDNLKVSLRQPRSFSMLASAILPTVNLMAISLAITGSALAFRAAWLTGAATMGVLVALRSTVMLRRRAIESWRSVPQVIAVAAAYELGRAFAALGRFGYGRRRAADANPVSASRGGGAQ